MTTNYFPQQFGLEIFSSKGIPAVLPFSTMCSSLSPLGFPCSQRGGTLSSPSSGSHQQILPSSMGREHQHASETSEMLPAGTQEKKQQLKSAQHPNSSPADPPIPTAVSVAAMPWHTPSAELHRLHTPTGSSSAAAKCRGKKYLPQPESLSREEQPEI